MTINIFDLWLGLQRQLFPALHEEVGPLGDKDRQFVETLALLPDGPFFEPYRWSGNGRPPASRLCLWQSFVAKSVYGFPTTSALIDELHARPTLRRLCGWELAQDVPSEPTFSRAFAEFATDELTQRIHEATVKIHCGPKLVGHVSRDATAIAARERPAALPTPAAAPPAPPRQRGRPKKGQAVPPPPPTRLELQSHRSLR